MKKFKTESKRMLDLVINSIYTNREIFLRELLSNGSDAIDKLYYKSLTEGLSGLTRDDFFIKIDVDKDLRTLKITDNGIGMTDAELENNLGTIAKSGSFDFKKSEDGKDKDVDIIGQFGVGFYSAFMVAKKVEVLSKAFGSDKAYKWTSSGTDGYEIDEAEKDSNGTEITLYLKDDADGDRYSEYLEEYKIRELVKKYSDYIRYPIKMMVTSYEYDDEDDKCGDECECHYEHEHEHDENCECCHDDDNGEEQKEAHTEPKEVKKEQVLNSMTPVWRKTKAELKEGEYEKFYKDEFYDAKDPLKVIYTSAEGAVDYKALLFIPETIPYNYYTKSYEKGLKLYTSGVMITDKCADLLPDHFNFVKGVVDSDVTLNISRETVQQNRQLKAIKTSLEKKIRTELLSMQKNEREKYEKFFDNFGLSIKYGIYSAFGMNNDALTELIMFKSAKTGKYVTLQEYVDSCAQDQKNIYYATGRTVEACKAMPKLEAVLDKGYDVLCLTDDVDEFCVKMIGKYKDFEFKSYETEDVGVETTKTIDKDVENAIMEDLKGKIVKVRLSENLKNHPVSLTSEGELSIEMEKVFAKMPNNSQSVKAQKVLEINANHPVYEKLCGLLKGDRQKFDDLVNVLYGQASLIVGLEVENITDLTDKIFNLIV